jgi:hypothetical protein
MSVQSSTPLEVRHMCLAQNAKMLEASHGKLGDLVSWSIPSRLPNGTAELLDDVVSEVMEYIQGHNCDNE